MSAYVVFFGGYRATVCDIAAWKASAMKQKPQVTFDGYAYPSPHADGDKAVEAFKKSGDYAKAIKAIEGSKRDVIFIVGHSSGCAIANAVDAGLKDHTKVTLVALDGYAPSAEQLARPSTQVWVAECGHAISLHYHDLQKRINDFNVKAKNKTKVNIYKATNCYHKWALHFSLVNVASSDTLVADVPDGYKDCQANLMWM